MPLTIPPRMPIKIRAAVALKFADTRVGDDKAITNTEFTNISGNGSTRQSGGVPSSKAIIIAIVTHQILTR
jgi:hypothetical protein